MFRRGEALGAAAPGDGRARGGIVRNPPALQSSARFPASRLLHSPAVCVPAVNITSKTSSYGDREGNNWLMKCLQSSFLRTQQQVHGPNQPPSGASSLGKAGFPSALSTPHACLSLASRRGLGNPVSLGPRFVFCEVLLAFGQKPRSPDGTEGSQHRRLRESGAGGIRHLPRAQPRGCRPARGRPAGLL